jgi:hypothetical protein
MARTEGDEILLAVLAGDVQVDQCLAGTRERLGNDLVLSAVDDDRRNDHTRLVMESAKLHALAPIAVMRTEPPLPPRPAVLNRVTEIAVLELPSLRVSARTELTKAESPRLNGRAENPV